MNKMKTAAALCLVLLSFPLSVSAMGKEGHGSHEKAGAAEAAQVGGHHDTMKDGDHGGHNAHAASGTDAAMMNVGSMVSKGVKGTARLKNVAADMAKMGMKTTHHFMISFLDEKTGESIDKGAVALKITNPDAKVGDTIELVGMAGHFGADVVLDLPGEYHFRLGTKLVDGTKRKYHFHQVIQ